MEGGQVPHPHPLDPALLSIFLIPIFTPDYFQYWYLLMTKFPILSIPSDYIFNTHIYPWLYFQYSYLSLTKTLKTVYLYFTLKKNVFIDLTRSHEIYYDHCSTTTTTRDSLRTWAVQLLPDTSQNSRSAELVSDLQLQVYYRCTDPGLAESAINECASRAYYGLLSNFKVSGVKF